MQTMVNTNGKLTLVRRLHCDSGELPAVWVNCATERREPSSGLTERE